MPTLKQLEDMLEVPSHLDDEAKALATLARDIVRALARHLECPADRLSRVQMGANTGLGPYLIRTDRAGMRFKVQINMSQPLAVPMELWRKDGRLRLQWFDESTDILLESTDEDLAYVAGRIAAAIGTVASGGTLSGSYFGRDFAMCTGAFMTRCSDQVVQDFKKGEVLPPCPICSQSGWRSLFG